MCKYFSYHEYFPVQSLSLPWLMSFSSEMKSELLFSNRYFVISSRLRGLEHFIIFQFREFLLGLPLQQLYHIRHCGSSLWLSVSTNKRDKDKPFSTLPRHTFHSAWDLPVH
ncbi:hypothetical protein OIU77_023844 [Salix suchowensis]|uniref:Maturase K n=1 Tax=Salix suchowensis TaxID=1278906 RepID=A0ABQ9C8D4_9ROSI|nr:hypothetical protein OIU77_023844 [Salix suchowensis]